MLLVMFELKKLLGGLIMPLPLFGLLAFVMLVLAFRARKSALVIASLSLLALLVLSTPFAAHQLIKNNEPASLAFNALKQALDDVIDAQRTVARDTAKINAELKKMDLAESRRKQERSSKQMLATFIKFGKFTTTY